MEMNEQIIEQLEKFKKELASVFDSAIQARDYSQNIIAQIQSIRSEIQKKQIELLQSSLDGKEQE